jgi:hypothetical protein
VSDWPAVQVVFLLETTPFDGAFRALLENGDEGLDPCAGGGVLNYNLTPLCGESNGIPFFVANAGTIAKSIQTAHPFTNVTFGLVDYGATYDNWDDSQGASHDTFIWNTTGCPPFPCQPPYISTNWDDTPSFEYHVDVGRTVPAAAFQSAVEQTFQKNVLDGGMFDPSSNLSDNFLHSSSITALYGALTGQGIDWAPDTHHVLVLVGSAAPRDPGYLQNYCVSTSIWASLAEIYTYYTEIGWPIGGQEVNCLANDTLFESPGCEPAYNFSGMWTPACEGWVQSQDGIPGNSIAALATQGAACDQSLGNRCTIDVIDLYTMSTDPGSHSWWSWTTCPVNSTGWWNASDCSAANSWWAKENVHRVISAGCDLANATGGTWDGPVIDGCNSTGRGTLLFVSPENFSDPVTSNPTLESALAAIGFGDPPPGLMLRAMASTPMFQFVPWGNFHVDLHAPTAASCLSANQIPTDCDSTPSERTVGGVTALTWNWSTDPNLDVLYVGDVWTATLSVYADGPPFLTPTPVDACITTACTAAGSQAVAGAYTSMWAVQLDGSVLVESFPYVNVTVLLPAGQQTAPTSSPPPPPPPGSGPPVLNPPSAFPIAAPQPVLGGSIVVVSVSLPALAVGILAAGMTRIALRPRSIRTAVVVPLRQRTAGSSSRTREADNIPVGRFE